MTLWRENARAGNRESEVDGRLRGREVAATRQLARPPGARKGKLYVRIRWDIRNGSDTSDGEVVTAAGVSLGRTVSVDGVASLLAVSPTLFGDAYYECEAIGWVSSTVPTSKRRQKVRAIRFAGASAAVKPCVIDTQGISFGHFWGSLYNSGGTGILTTVGGVAGPNYVPAIFPSGVYPGANIRFDTHLPARYQLQFDAAKWLPSLVPDILQTSRRRGGRVNGGVILSTSGGPFTIFLPCSLDFGEIFHLSVAIDSGYYSAPADPYVVGGSFTRMDLTGSFDSSSGINLIGIVGGVAQAIKTDVTQSSAFALPPNGGPTATAFTFSIPYSYTYWDGTHVVPWTSPVMTVTFTFSTTIIGITLSFPSLAGADTTFTGEAVALLEGGRGVWAGASTGGL